jgi:hypothetical protein
LWLLNPSTFVEYFLLIKVIVLWDFQSKETIVEAFDMIVVENNVPLVIDKDDYPQKLNEIVETWCA